MLALATALTLLATSRVWDPASGSLALSFDPSANRLLPDGDPDKQFYDATRTLFGNDESMMVVIGRDDVFDAEGLRLLARLTARIRDVEGVRTVTSLASAPDIRSHDGRIEIAPLFDEVPDDPASLAAIRRAALGNPVFRGNLVSADGRTALIQIEFREFSDREFVQRAIDQEIARLVRVEAGDAEVWITGAPYIKAAQIRTQLSEMQRFIPMILGVMALVLAFSFRTVRGVILPLVTIVVALAWCMGIAAWIGRPLNLITALVPSLMIILGLSYAVHVVSEFYDALREDPDAAPATAMAQTLEKIWLPVLLTGLTTGAGFLALAVSPMRAMSEFGVLSLVGVLAAVLASLSVTPASLVAFGRPRRIARARDGSAFARLARWAGDMALLRRERILALWAGVCVVAVLAATNVRVGSDSIQSFAPDVPVRTDYEAINARLDGANSFDLVIEADERGAFLEPTHLAALEAFQTWLESLPEIGGTTSMVEFIKLCHRGFAPAGDASLAIPASRKLVGQMVYFCAGEQLESYVDSSHRRAKIAVRTSVIGSSELSDLVERIEARAADALAPLVARATGNRIVIQSLVDDLTRNQMTSLLVALAVIWLLLSLMFLSWRIGVLALIPNIVPIVVFFGAMGATGVSLNFATSLIAPMALGIAIDDTIHYFARFQEDAKRFADERRATVRALEIVGRPITYTTLSVVLGFLVLTQSDQSTWIQLGAMGAFTLAVAWAVDFSLTPALCGGLRIATMWDTLRLDLGPDPQDSIPLFRGLTGWECRLAALIASIRQLPRGEIVMRAGEEGREMYLVIDGALEIFVNHPDGSRDVINTCRRGDVIGEVGFFHKKRSASVEVVEDARLLRLTQKNMEKLTRRYPRVAAKVLRNLGQIMAERLSNTTARLEST